MIVLIKLMLSGGFSPASSNIHSAFGIFRIARDLTLPRLAPLDGRSYFVWIKRDAENASAIRLVSNKEQQGVR